MKNNWYEKKKKHEKLRIFIKNYERFIITEKNYNIKNINSYKK